MGDADDELSDGSEEAPRTAVVPESTAVDRNRELLRRAHALGYKSVDDIDLEAFVFYPEDHEPSDRRAAIVFFFGGAWDHGLVSQFAPHCYYFAARGMVAVAVDYRVASRHGVTPLAAMADARSAIRWIRQNAAALGVDPERVAAAGASAGAHAALAAAMTEGFDEPDEDASVSAAPSALVLFSPAVDISPKGFGFTRFPDAKTARGASPMRHVRKGLPPTIIFQGTADRVVSADAVRKFRRKMRWKRNRCDLHEFKGQGHGFFNFNVDVGSYEATISLADQFLVDLGYLAPNPQDDGSPRLD